jgi:hypothetical protein
MGAGLIHLEIVFDLFQFLFYVPSGLGSILFAISIDNEDLNSVQKPTGLDQLLS